MARLYKYADSNDKTGYFIWDGSEEGNATFQVSPLAEQLLDRMDFEPGVVNKQRGPRLPDQLQWALFEVGLIYTGEMDASPVANFDDEVEGDGEETKLSDELLGEIESFIRETKSDRTEVQELADLLDIDPGSTKHEAIWNLSESKMEGIEGYVREYLRACLNADNTPCWSVSVNCTSQTIEETEKGVLAIQIEHVAEESQKYHHVVYFCPEHGFERIATASVSVIDWESRSRLERHRGYIIEAVTDIPNELDHYIGEPTADIDLLTHEKMDIFD